MTRNENRRRRGSQQGAIRFAIGRCSLGYVLVASASRGVCSIVMGDDADAVLRQLQRRFPGLPLSAAERSLAPVLSKVLRFVEAPRLGLDLSLAPDGTEFQQRVWQALIQVRVGTTASYTDIARSIGSPRAVRAVARACAANPVALAIPCHRILRRDGGLSGYRWGVRRKRALLAREAQIAARAA